MSNTAAKTIIFPTDFSDISVTALPWVTDLAGALNTDISCLFVVEEPQIYSSLDMGAAAIPTTGELVDSAKERMRKFISEYLGDAPGKVNGEVRVGHAATEIVGCAKEKDAAMIIMTTHGYSGVKHVLLGSTTEDVLRHAECPVLSVRAQA
jgi:nucleotide-binding universal stress UspA family protein